MTEQRTKETIPQPYQAPTQTTPPEITSARWAGYEYTTR
jgi:hypothetical protein